jgi:hypothetical protein
LAELRDAGPDEPLVADHVGDHVADPPTGIQRGVVALVRRQVDEQREEV